jgi:putative addiction module component (TIGR02574 family)
MPRKISEIVEEARQLPYGERAELIERLILANAQEVDPKIDEAWKQVTRQRIAEIRSGQAKGVPVEDALAEARKRAGV